ncbi:MAG: hypothetical protein WCH79_14815 [Planctomycetia bacterium]
MSNPWRDVYPIEFWDEMVGKYRSGALESSSATVGRWMRSVFKTGRVLPQQIERITNTLRDYHNVPKDEINNFQTRIGYLRSIHHDSVEYCNKYEINKTVKEKKKTAEDTFTSMDAYVWSIGRRALRKADYIEVIQKFCTTNSLSDPTKMLQYLRDTRHQVDAFQHLQMGCRMEKLDPFHRSFELHVDADKNMRGFFGTPMVEAFGRWIGAITDDGVNNDNSNLSPPEKHFFVWLETHELTKGGEWGGSMESWKPKSTKSVKYRDTATDTGDKWWHWLCSEKSGALYELDLESLSTTLFNTNNGSTKPGDEGFKTYAYVWAESGELLAGVHKAGSVHHSSFEAGKKVRCAGMIAVNDAGKVTMVNSNSGHYRPTKQQLTLFVEWLNRRGVFSNEALIGEGSDKKIPVAEFLRLQEIKQVNKQFKQVKKMLEKKLLDFGL